MQKLFPSVSEATNAVSASSSDTPSPPASPQAAPNPPEPAAATAPVNPFAWPPPEEDLDDWHVFQFGDNPNPPAAAAAPTPVAKPSQTPTLKIVSPFGERDKEPTLPPAFATPDTEPIAAPIISAPIVSAPTAFGTPATEPIAAPIVNTPRLVTPAAAPATPAPATFGLQDTQPIVSPIISPAPASFSPASLVTGDTTRIANPIAPAPVPAAVIGVTFASPETEPHVVPLPPAFAARVATPAPVTQTRESTSTTITSLGLSGALSETGTSLPARRVQTVAPVPVSGPVSVATDATLTPATVEVLARSAHAARGSRSSVAWFRRTLVIALALLAIGEAAYIATLYIRKPAAAIAQTAALSVQSQPAGADVTIDGQARGKTPLRLDLPAGEHQLELRKDGMVRKMPLTLAAGAQASQYIELRASDVEAASPASNPAPGTAPGQRPAPSANVNLPAGAAGVAGTVAATGTAATGVAGAGAAAGTASVAPTAPPARPVPTIGWLVVQSPVTLSILRNGEAIGNSDDGRLAIGPGRHELELSNTAAGYREAMAIQIVAGRETVLQPELPQSTLDVESTPRARVSIDGRDVGETPLNQLALTIGPHEIMFRHPDFPERQVSTFIRVGTPAHVSVDLSNP